MYKYLLLVLASLLVLSQVEARKPKDQIRQCKCSELDECRERSMEPLLKCQEKCIKGLKNDDWDKEEGQKCLMNKKVTEHDKCLKEAMVKTCDNEPGKYLNLNETNEHARKHHKHRRHRSVDELNNSTVVTDGSDKEEPTNTEASESEEDHGRRHHKQREHHKAAFHAFIQQNFGRSGKNFAKCMNTCSHRFQKVNCARKLKCGTKKLPKEEWKEVTSTCDKKKVPKRYETCDCLAKAGVKNLDCTFGGKREKDEQRAVEE
ncbi:unnamed protein product [Bursaphelenchus okinawaensis]|uniref:Uncharacterized protein n=1 Tax=Bursaphelenchus okinawaensis TaxID=465554 RepID=A0A811L7D7_9BILA|nr:unnamed protein product [Bursaphelenchus okinawaensis]CAG9117202.1 unnamed protein product [Bursaphelenchus okinawaensis]